VTTPTEQTPSSSGLPFDPLTLLVGLILRWKIVVIALVFSLILGAVAAKLLGKETFETETIIFYKEPDKKDDAGGRNPSVSNRATMLKIPSNLRAVSEKLKLGLAPQKLAGLIQVKVEKRTSLIIITAQWSTAKEVAKIANTMREVFIANQVAMMRADVKNEIDGIETKLEVVNRHLKDADQKLQTFILDNKIVDLNKEIQWNVDQIASMESLLSNSKNEEDTIETQKLNIQERITNLKAKVVEEQSVSKAGKSLADLNIRIERLRRAIHDDKVKRKNTVEMSKDELAYLRAKELLDKGLIAKQDFEKAKAEFEAKEVDAVDTEEIEEWRRQLKVLEGEVIPEKENFKSPTQEMLSSLQVKLLDMELQQVSLSKKVDFVNNQIIRVKARLEVLSGLQRQHTALSKEVSTWDAQKSELESALGKLRKDYESNDSGFVLVSEAPVPLQSIKSNKKIFFGAIACLCTVIGFVVIVISELNDKTIKSGSEVQSKFSRPVLGTIPDMKDQAGVFPDMDDFPLIETFRLISLNVRRHYPKRGVRIMITSAERWEGKTMVAANLAACMGRQDERVLVMDAQIRSMESEVDLRYMIAEHDKPLKGLGEWLSYDVLSPEEMIWPTVLAGVECIPRLEAAVSPDLLSSMRMKELMETLSENFSFIIVDGPPVGTLVDAELIAQCCDAMIFVVRSRSCVSSVLKKSVERMRGTGTPVAGFVVNYIDPLYLKWT
jgi:capsular exopolysaccharide synthesis family protein